MNKKSEHRALFLVSLAYNQATKVGTLPESGTEFNVPIPGLGPSMTALFTGWYCDAAVIDVAYFDETVATGWLLRSRRQARLVDFYSMSSIISQVPSGDRTKLLTRTSKRLSESTAEYLMMRHTGHVYCASNTPCP